MKLFSSLCLTLALITVLPAAAKPHDPSMPTAGYLYFNMPGTTMARHDGELKNCIEYWSGAGESEPFDGPAGTGILGAAVSSAMFSNYESARMQINIERCMVAKGWRLVRLAPEEAERMAQMPQKALADVLQRYVGAETPLGEIAWVWNNDEASEDMFSIGIGPKDITRKNLSVLAVSSDNPPLAGITSLAPDVKNRANGKRVGRPMELSTATPPPPGQSLLVYSVRLRQKLRGDIVFLEQADAENPMNSDFFGIKLGKNPVLQDDGSYLVYGAVLVPSGTWFVQGGSFHLDNCLGAPFFKAESGSTIYLGTWDYTNLGIRIDADTTDINKVLAGQGIRVAPAQWINGYTYPCRQLSMYALEFDGYPFAPGYHWGSRAQAGD